MSSSPSVIQFLPASIEEFPAFVRMLEEFNLLSSDFFILNLIQRLDLDKLEDRPS